MSPIDPSCCVCGETAPCPTCERCCYCETAFDTCPNPDPHCIGGCWIECRFCTADRKDGTR